MSEKKETSWEDLPIYGTIYKCETVTAENKGKIPFSNYSKLGELVCWGSTFVLTTPREMNESLKRTYEQKIERDPDAVFDVQEYLDERNAIRLHEMYLEAQEKLKERELNTRELNDMLMRMESDKNLHFVKTDEPMRNMTAEEKIIRANAIKDYLITRLNLRLHLSTMTIKGNVKYDLSGKSNDVGLHDAIQAFYEFGFSKKYYDGSEKPKLLKEGIKLSSLPKGDWTDDDIKKYLTDDPELLLKLAESIVGDMEDAVSMAKNEQERAEKVFYDLRESVNQTAFNKVPIRIPKINEKYFYRNSELQI